MEQNKWKAISPSHYKDVVPGYQYMQLMKYMLKDFEGDEAHLSVSYTHLTLPTTPYV